MNGGIGVKTNATYYEVKLRVGRGKEEKYISVPVKANNPSHAAKRMGGNGARVVGVRKISPYSLIGDIEKTCKDLITIPKKKGVIYEDSTLSEFIFNSRPKRNHNNKNK